MIVTTGSERSPHDGMMMNDNGMMKNDNGMMKNEW
jgi:hypothetical protein